MIEVTPARSFTALFIWLDLAWLAVLATFLLAFRRRVAAVVGLAGAALYFAVDYGIFLRLLGTRVVEGADPLWLLLWLSVSYGFTNFAWIWLLLDRDERAVEWSVLVISGWLAVAQLARAYGGGFASISIARGTEAYHGPMTLILLLGYGMLVARNLRADPDGRRRLSLLWLLAIGIGVQASWESVLMISGIRPMDWRPLVVDSLIETNLGLPWLWMIHAAVSRKWNRKADPITEPG